MSIYTAPDTRLLAQMGDEINQLTQPFTQAIRQRGRRTKTRWTAIRHPPLLDQLKAAATPTVSSINWDRTRHTDIRIPINIGASNALDVITEGITEWRWRTIPTHHHQHDFAGETLRALLGATPNIAPSLAHDLASDVHHWWKLAAIFSGWMPDDLTDKRHVRIDAP